MLQKKKKIYRFARGNGEEKKNLLDAFDQFLLYLLVNFEYHVIML